MVFIHGLYFGSTEELNLAHVEGFLFEMFKDSGLYPTTAHSIRKSHHQSAVSDHSDYDHDESSTDETAESYEKFTLDDEDEDYEEEEEEEGDNGNENEENQEIENSKNEFDTNMIEFESNKEVVKAEKKSIKDVDLVKFEMDLSAVAQANQLSAMSGSRRSQLVSVPVSFVRSIKTSGCLDSELSMSLSSVNRQKMCESFVRKAQKLYRDHQMGSKTKTMSVSALAGASKQVLATRSTKSCREKTCQRSCCTPPRDVLAKINEWMQMTQAIIERRNREIANKRLHT